MDVKNCVICLEDKDNKKFITYGKCNHSVVCIDCYIYMHYPIIDVYSTSECTICRTISKNSDLKYTVDIEECKYYETSIDLYKVISKYLKNVKNDQNTKGIINTLLTLYNSFECSSPKFSILFSKDQTESLLTIVRNRNMNEWDGLGYRFFNVLVAMCYEPWNIEC